MNKSANRFLKVFPWYSGLSSDLLFYIAIDTLFLTLVKKFSAAEIVSLSSLSQLICVLLQFPVLFIIKKIGNTASVRTGAFFMLLSAFYTLVSLTAGIIIDVSYGLIDPRIRMGAK